MNQNQFRLWAVYGLAHFGKSLLWASSGIVFAFFLTEIVAVPPHLMGVVIGASLTLHAAFDYGTGRLMRSRVQTHTEAAQAQLIGAILATVSFVLFSTTGLLPDDARLGHVLATLILFRLGCALYDVPQNAFMAFVTETDRARARYSALRYVMSGAAALLITLIVTPVIRSTGEQMIAQRFVQLAVMIAAISLICALTLFLYTRFFSYSPANSSMPSDDDGGVYRSLDSQRTVLFIGMLISIFALNLAASVFSNLEAYFVAFALKQQEIAATYFLVAIAIGQMMAQPVWGWLSAHWGLERIATLGSFMLGFSGLAFIFVGHLGGATTLICALLYGASYGGVAMSVWSMLARSTASAPARTTQRYGMFTACSKLSQAFAILVVGVALSVIDYRDNALGQHHLRIIMGAAPILGGIVLWLISRSGLVRDRPGLSRSDTPE